MSPRLSATVLTLALVGLLALSACSTGTSAADPSLAATSAAGPAPAPTPGPPASTAAPTGRASASTSTARPSPTIVEPTTTNTLPPPPRPSKPAPSTAGKLAARSLPVPKGWRTVVRAGSSEEGYEGNGTWVHARDPRYAAQAVVTLGCADVTRDDYPDPRAALEGTYQNKVKKSEPGVGLVLDFASDQRARAFYTVYLAQIRACEVEGGPVQTKVIDSSLGLIDQRTYPDGDWTDVGALRGSRLTLVILTDPGHRISRAESEALLRQIRAG